MNPLLYILNTTLSYYLFFSSFLPVRPQLSKSKIIVAILATSVLRQLVTRGVRWIFAGNLSAITITNGIGTILIFVLVVALFSGKWYIKCFLVVVLDIVLMGVDFASYLCLAVVQGVAFSAQSSRTLSGWAPVFVQIFIHVGVILLKLFRRPQKMESNRNAFLLQIVVPLISSLYILYLIFFIFSNATITTADWVNICTLLLINLSLYFVFRHMESVHHKNREYQLDQQQQQLREEYYQEVENYQRQIRTIKHDLTNQLISVQGYVDNAQHGEASRQVGQMIQNLTAAAELDFTRHAGLNALLGAQYLRATREGILCEFRIRVPEEMAFAPEDLSALLGNLLDNAREACLRHDGTRYLRLVMVYHGHTLIIQTENSVESIVKDLHSSKEDPQNHGLGFASMRAVVEKYGGDLQYRAEPGRFFVEATLPEPNDDGQQGRL